MQIDEYDVYIHSSAEGRRTKREIEFNNHSNNGKVLSAYSAAQSAE